EGHGTILEANALIELASAVRMDAESGYGLQANMELQAAYLEPSAVATDQSSSDAIARLRVTRPLYDFGQTELKITAADDEQQAIVHYKKFIIEKRKIDIARQFFEVLLADLKYAWDNEAMAIAYVRFDAQKKRHGLSDISDIELLEFESNYQSVRLQRNASEIKQRSARAGLAEALNRAEQLPSNLITPELSFAERKLPDYEQLLAQANKNNLQLKLHRTYVDAAQKRMLAARYQTRPTLAAGVTVSEYDREFSSSDKWRLELNLTVPLFESQAMQATIARQRSQWLKQRAMLVGSESKMRQQVLELWQKIRLLINYREQLQVSMDFTELALDRNRALYEMEVKTNLGDAMVAVSEMRYKKAKAEFDLALAWMELDLVTTNQLLQGEAQ
ncbi:MAG: TolC family protein, partial [Gammaproteobacteria bacterium]|nr:TolC family protein [Gammaproteobacteria bacterium]